MEIKHKTFSAVTKRWAVPIAIVLLPGGFVLLALGWVYKIWQSGKPVASVEVAEVVNPPFSSALAKILAAASVKTQRAPAAPHENSVPRRPRGQPADEPQEHATL